MGQKGSKKKEKYEGIFNLLAHETKEQEVEEEEGKRTFDLTRSTQTDREHNSLGLPEDVLVLIVSHLSLEDLASASKTCKTWRRILYKDVVWRSVALKHDVELQEGQHHVRQQVVEHFSKVMSKDFQMVPFEESKLYNMMMTRKKRSNDDLLILVVSSSNPSGQGKSSLVSQWAHDPTIADAASISVALSSLADQHDVEVSSSSIVVHVQRYTFLDLVRCDATLVCSRACCIVVVDTFTGTGRVKELKRSVETVIRLATADQSDIPMLVVRTKSDLEEPFEDKKKMLQWCKKNKYPFISTSAKCNINVERAFKLATLMGLHYHLHQKKY